MRYFCIMRNKLRVFLADRQPVVRKGLEHIVGRIPGAVVCGEAANVARTFRSTLRNTPDIVILDWHLSGKNGVSLVRRLKGALPNTRILVFSPLPSKPHVQKAIQAGADGWVPKDAPPERLINVLQNLLMRRSDDGDFGVRKSSDRRQTQVSGGYRGSPLDRLSVRELEVFRLIGRGRGTSQIAQELRLSAKTIETYREHIKIKLNLADAGALREHAIHKGRHDWPEKIGVKHRHKVWESETGVKRSASAVPE